MNFLLHNDIKKNKSFFKYTGVLHKISQNFHQKFSESLSLVYKIVIKKKKFPKINKDQQTIHKLISFWLK
jgi:hypothetical protein